VENNPHHSIAKRIDINALPTFVAELVDHHRGMLLLG
jgi:hypothetical protein